MKTTVYSTTTCPYCKMLVKWLNEHNIDYTEYKVDLNPYAAQTMVALSGQMGVPFTTIEDEASGSLEKVLGFDVPALNTIFNLKKGQSNG